MVFNDSSVRIQTRVRSAIGRLRLSKSFASLSSLALAESQDSEVPPPLPLALHPIVNQPPPEAQATESDVSDDFWDTKPTAPVMLKRSARKLTKRTAGFKRNRATTSAQPPPPPPPPQPTLDAMLEQQGLLDSPISFHITSLIAESCDSSSSSSRTTRRRSSSDSAYLSNLLYRPSAGTAELVVVNTVGKSTPELCGSHSNIVQPQSCLPQSMSTSDEDSLPSPPQIKTIFVVHSPDPSLPPRKLSASPAQLYLRRPGLIPSNQPLTSELLQSVISTPHGFTQEEPEDTSIATITPQSLGLVYNSLNVAITSPTIEIEDSDLLSK